MKHLKSLFFAVLMIAPFLCNAQFSCLTGANYGRCGLPYYTYTVPALNDLDSIQHVIQTLSLQSDSHLANIDEFTNQIMDGSAELDTATLPLSAYLTYGNVIAGNNMQFTQAIVTLIGATTSPAVGTVNKQLSQIYTADNTIQNQTNPGTGITINVVANGSTLPVSSNQAIIAAFVTTTAVKLNVTTDLTGTIAIEKGYLTGILQNTFMNPWEAIFTGTLTSSHTVTCGNPGGCTVFVLNK